MNFDKSRVYTTLNANELKVGSKVIAESNLSALKESVLKCRLPKTIKKVESSEDLEYRFLCDDDFHYPLAYLVEEPKQLKWTDLKIGDVITDGKRFAMVTEIDTSHEDSLPVFAGNNWFSDAMLAGWTRWENEKN